MPWSLIHSDCDPHYGLRLRRISRVQPLHVTDDVKMAISLSIMTFEAPFQYPSSSAVTATKRVEEDNSDTTERIADN